MKTQLHFLKLTLLISFFSVSIFSFGYAQQRNLQHELLVYILPDSLEIPDLKKEKYLYTEAKVLSKSLKSVLNDVNPEAIGKAFPKWVKADSIKTSDNGIKIKIPH